jgi:hypothetical protein
MLHVRVKLVLSALSFAHCACANVAFITVFGSFKPYPDNDDGVQKKYS